MQYGYIRIANFAQDNLADIEEQKKQIHKRYPDAVILQEQSVDSIEQKSLDEIIEIMNQEDILICTTLDRFCLDIDDGIEDIYKILKKGCSVHILNMGLINDTETGQLIFKQLFAFTRFQKVSLPERCWIGKIKAKQNPQFREGRKPKYTIEQLEDAYDLLNQKTYQQVKELTGISNSTLHRYKVKKEKNVKE